MVTHLLTSTNFHDRIYLVTFMDEEYEYDMHSSVLVIELNLD